MDKILSINEPEKLEYLIKKSEEADMKYIPIPIEFAKELLTVLKDGTVKHTFP